MIRRRTFLAAAATAIAGRRVTAQVAEPTIMTVTGLIPGSKLGVTLPHEHVMVDFIGTAEATPDRYDADEVVEVVLPHLKRIAELGCRSLIECTPAYLARDPGILATLSRASGVQILTNTGYYGARNDQHLPAHAFTETAAQLAARWTREYEDGIENSGVKPGFIKIGVDRGPLSDIDRKLIDAAAICHRQTGLTIAAHTGPAEAAFEQLDVLAAHHVAAAAWVWVHAQAERDSTRHIEAARRGAWVEFDGVGPASIERHVTLVKTMKENGLLHRVLISQDAGWYRVGEQRGGKFRPYDTLFTEFLPALRNAGFSDDQIKQLTVTNPAEAFAVRKRLT